MNGIKFNTATKEVEIQGSESFIESNFDMIGNLLCKTSETMKAKESTKTRAREERVIFVETIEPLAATAVIDIPKTKQVIEMEKSEAPQVPKVKRAPVRKYFNTLGKLIRSEDTSINRDSVVNVNENAPGGISIASLKEKFGLPDEKIQEVIRDAERNGKVRRDMDGSLVWG